MTNAAKGAFGADDDLVDYILGITFEIWEERGIDLIDQYYGPETIVICVGRYQSRCRCDDRRNKRHARGVPRQAAAW